MQISGIRLSDKTSRRLSRATPSAVSEHFSESIGFPISMSFATSNVSLELRSLPSAGVTRFPRYYEPLRHPRAPGLSLAGVRLVPPSLTPRRLGLPVLRALSLCTCCRHYPGAASGRRLRSSHPAVISLPRKGRRVCPHIGILRLARRSLALRPAHLRRHLNVTCYTEGFNHFVTSMTAPVASGWSVSPGGTCTHWKAPPFTAHTLCRRSRLVS